MGDRLVSLLKWFELRARVFQTGPLCRSVNFNTGEGFGYLHVLRTGSMRVETLGQGISRSQSAKSGFLHDADEASPDTQARPHRFGLCIV